MKNREDTVRITDQNGNDLYSPLDSSLNNWTIKYYPNGTYVPYTGEDTITFGPNFDPVDAYPSPFWIDPATTFSPPVSPDVYTFPDNTEKEKKDIIKRLNRIESMLDELAKMMETKNAV